MKKVRFSIDDELGSEPILSLDMTLFLAEGETIEQSSAHISTTTEPQFIMAYP